MKHKKPLRLSIKIVCTPNNIFDARKAKRKAEKQRIN